MFQTMVENQLGKKIKFFRSDNGGGFSKKEFLDHLLDCGIVHQLSCLGTPYQNSIAERKHRHVVELKPAMLYQALVPKHL